MLPLGRLLAWAAAGTPFFNSWIGSLAGAQNNSTEISCFETPIISPQPSELALHVRNLARTALYDNLQAYQHTADIANKAALNISLTAEAYVGTRRELIIHLDEIQHLLERTKQDLEVTRDGPPPVSPDFMQTVTERKHATIDLQLSKAEYKIVSILSSFRDPTQEREREAVMKVENQVSAAMSTLDDFVSTFTWDRRDYGIGPMQVIRRRVIHRIRNILWLPSQWLSNMIGSLSPSQDSVHTQGDLKSQMHKHAAIAHSNAAHTAFQAFLSSLEAWKPLESQTRRQWDTIDSRMHDYMRDTSPTTLRDAVQRVLALVQDFGAILDEELQAFMDTWGRPAGYVWAGVAPGTAGARACRPQEAEL